MNPWRLFAPPEDWRHPIEIEESDLALLTTVGERLGLRLGRDDAQHKFFLGVPETRAESSRSGEGVRYPSGLSIPKAALSVAEAARYGITGKYTAAPLLAAKPTDRLSDHFTAAEFLCHDTSYKYLRVSSELVRRLEQIRAKLGAAIHVNSGYRPPEYNRSVGGEINSAHIDGLAADIRAEGVSMETLRRVCEEVIGKDGGLGYYPDLGFCHVDVRGYEARW